MSAWRDVVRNLPRTRGARGIALLAAGLWLAGCSGDAGAPASAGARPPPPEVGVVRATPTSVGLSTELPGRTEASRVAQVRARAAGILQRRLFREGSTVRAGQPLFQIDDAPYRAALASARAAQAKAEANLMQAGALAERYKPLVEARAVSQQDYVSAVAAQKQAEADVAAAAAAEQTARINLDYAAVRSPIAGRIGRALVTEGALVGQGEATELALVQQIDPMYVNFTEPVAQVMQLRAAIAGGRLASPGEEASARVRLVLEDGSVYPLPGRLLFSDLSVDPGSGQIVLRAEVPNPRGVLLPGLYVRGRIEQARATRAILLPQQAVARTNLGDSVKVVGADGMVSTRTVRLGAAAVDGQWVVLDGLAPGEQVIVDGFQKLRGSGPVRPVGWTPPPAARPDAAAPAASAASARG